MKILPNATVHAILNTIATGNHLSRQAQQRRLLKDRYWRPVLAVILAAKAYTGPALVADVVSADPLVAISQLNAEDARNLCQVIYKNRDFRNVYVGLFGGRTTTELIPEFDAGGNEV